MNFSYAPAMPIAATNVVSGTGSLFTRFWPVLILILAVFIGLVVYYSTIGYTIDLGWKRLFNVFGNKDNIDINMGLEGKKGGDYQASLVPDPIIPDKDGASAHRSKESMMGEPPKGDLPPIAERPSGMPGATPEPPSFLSMLNPVNLIPRGQEVYNVSRNIYTFHDAPAVCAAMGGELATYEQVKEAFENGADWCNYGWTKGQMAIYPTQKETYSKLQKGSPQFHNACGRPGVNGGYFDNPELLFGVNCVGIRPPQKSVDEMRENDVSFPASAEEIEFDKKVQKFREQQDTTNILPFNKQRWSA